MERGFTSVERSDGSGKGTSPRKVLSVGVRRLFWPVLFSIGFFVNTPPDFDLWWHLQVGRDICQEDVWPSPDIYAYATDCAWVVHSWLADCLFYNLWTVGESIHEGGGITILKVFRLIILIGFALSVYLWARHTSRNETLSLFAVLCISVLCWDRSIRPFLFTMLFFFYFYSFCARKDPRKYDCILMPLMMLLWANIHGGFAIAVSLLLCATAAQAIAPLVSVRRYHSRNWFVVSLISVAVTFVNPNPIGLYRRVYLASSYPTYDWLSMLAWLTRAPKATLDCALIYVAIFASWAYLNLRIRPSRSLLLSGRFATDVASFVLPVLHIRFLWMLVFPLLGAGGQIRKVLPAEPTPRLIPLLLLFLFFFLRLPNIPKTDVYRLPRESIDYFTEEGFQGNVFCAWHWGGYIIWMSDKKAQVFVDTRIEPFTLREIDLSLYAYEFPARFLGELVEYGTEFIIMPVNEHQPEWNMLGEKGLITFLHKNEHNFLARVNTDKVREVYAGTNFGADLPHEETPFR